MGFERRYKPLGRTEASLGSIDTHSDVTITSATTGDLLRFDGATWINYPDSNYAAASHTHLETEITDGALLARLADTETITGSWTFNSQVTLGDGDSTSGDILLYFATDRAWSFETFGADATTDLSLVSQSDGKYFRIRDALDTVQFQFLTSSTAPSFRAYDSTGTDYIQITGSTTQAVIESTQHIQLTPATGHEVFVYDPGTAAVFAVYDGTGNDAGKFSHNGTDFYLSLTNSDWWRVNGITNGILLQDGPEVRIYDDLNTDYVAFVHDGTDFNTTFVGTTAWTITVPSGGVVLESTGDVGLYLKADTDNVTESDNPFIRFEQDNNSVNAVIGLSGGTNVDAQGNIFTGGSDNSFVIHTPYTSGFLELGVGGVRGLRIDTNERVYMSTDSIGYFTAVTGNYGSVQVAGDEGSSGGYAGYSVNGRLVLMNNNSTIGGLYDDTNNEWFIRCTENADVELHYNGALVTQTVPATSGGLQVNNTSTGAGFERVLTTSDLGGGGPTVYGITVTGVGNASPSISVSTSNVSGWSVSDGNQTGETVVTHNLALGTDYTVLLTADHGADPGADGQIAYVEDRATNSFQIQMMDVTEAAEDGHICHVLVIDGSS